MEDKRPIPGWAYMIVGLAIIAYTKFIESKQPTAKIGIFFWAGIVFIVIGILKEFVPRMLAKRQRKELVQPPIHQQQHNPQHLHPGGHQAHGISPHATHQHVMPQQQPSHPYEPLHKQCPRCHILTHGKGRFCHNCGYQFF